MYAIDVIAGNTIRGHLELRAQTVREYLDSVNNLFTDRDFDPPIDFDLDDQPPALFYKNVKTWEAEPNRRTHLTPEFITELAARADQDTTGLGFIATMHDWTILGRYTGIRLSEYGQKTQKRAEYHTIPHKNTKVLKAFRRGDFVFRDKKGNRILDPVRDSNRVHTLTITWRVQKNRRNGQSITWIRDFEQPKLCPVLAAIRIVDRSIHLGILDDEPNGAYNEAGVRKYITGARITKLFQSIAKWLYPDITAKELSQYSSHMLRVTAAVLLQIAGKNSDFIQLRLRWEGDSYKMYLRDNAVMAHRHLVASVDSAAATAAYRLSPENLDDTFLQPTLVAQQPAAAVGSYEDFH